jgi:hypothetical protein
MTSLRYIKNTHVIAVDYNRGVLKILAKVFDYNPIFFRHKGGIDPSPDLKNSVIVPAVGLSLLPFDNPAARIRKEIMQPVSKAETSE